MKKLIILSLCFLAITQSSFSQCEQPTQLPYQENMETTPLSDVPECMWSNWSSFASYEVFNTIAGPVEGFGGKLLAYDTTVNTEFGLPASAYVSASLTTPLINLQQGMAYTVYFLYGNSNPDFTISSVSVELDNTNVIIGTIENVTGAQPANFISAQFTPPSNGNYHINIRVDSEGTQGLFYIDDIRVQQVGVMSIDTKNFAGLSLYPNPVKDIVTVSYTNAIESIDVYSSTGQLLLAKRPNALESSVNLSSFASGVYFINASSGGLINRSKILKE